MGNSTTLTKRIIESGISQAVSDGMERWLWDNRAPGLAARIKPSGRATFVLRYRNAEGRLRKLSIGAYGPFTVDKARSEAFHHIAEIKGVKRTDPAAERKGLRAGLTVAELCDQYLAASRNSIRASTLEMDRSRIEVHIKPLLGNRKVAGIKPADIEQLLNQIIEGKTAAVAKKKGRGGRARGGKAVAIRSARMLSVIFKRAVRDGAIAANPVTLVDRPTEDRYRPVFSWEAYSKLGAAWREMVDNGANQTALDAIYFLALTGARKSEVLTLEWSSVDEKEQCLRLPVTKTVAQNRVVGRAALALLAGRPKDQLYVFPATPSRTDTERPLVGLQKIWARLRKAAGLGDLHLHGLRHFFASAAHAAGHSKFIVAGLLGHAVRNDTDRYVSVVDQALVDAADKVSGRIRSLWAGDTADQAMLILKHAGSPIASAPDTHTLPI